MMNNLDWSVAFVFLLINAVKITQQQTPISEAQTICSRSASENKLAQFYDAEPNKCFLYTADVNGNASQKTVAYANALCNEWGTQIGFSCIPISPLNRTTFAEYTDNQILTSGMVCWAGCSKPNSTNETTDGWVWESATQSGTTVPALSIPWAPKQGRTPAQPDNNGGNANQCVYDGTSNGLIDENADSFASKINYVQCECVPLPNSNISTATYPPPTTTDTLPPTTTTPDISWMTPKQLLIYENLVKICYY